ncbi:MAG: hypothetical protein SFT91_00580 [Rickettsiaceae bacterium]|nr:hypothetical protein [Rickettsiaceae bacterium]
MTGRLFSPPAKTPKTPYKYSFVEHFILAFSIRFCYYLGINLTDFTHMPYGNIQKSHAQYRLDQQRLSVILNNNHRLYKLKDLIDWSLDKELSRP